MFFAVLLFMSFGHSSFCFVDPLFSYDLMNLLCKFWKFRSSGKSRLIIDFHKL